MDELIKRSAAAVLQADMNLASTEMLADDLDAEQQIGCYTYAHATYLIDNKGVIVH